MGLLSGFRDGFLFTSGKYFLYQGAYTSVPERPCVCDKCHSDSGCFHAHGRYARWVKTLKHAVLTPVRVWRQRWLCLCCGRTMSNGTPDVLSNVPNCTLVILALLWAYLEGGKGMHRSIPQEFYDAATPRTLARYVKRAKAVCLETQQAIREVLIEIRDPRPWDESFHHGLSPPQSLRKRYRDSASATTLWRSLAILLLGSKTLSATPSVLMARARQKAEQRKSRFLI
jgi:hypothetical protein